MVAIAKMNKAQLIERVQELEAKNEAQKKKLGNMKYDAEHADLRAQETLSYWTEKVKVLQEKGETMEHIYNQYENGDFVEASNHQIMTEIIAESGDYCVVDTKTLEALQDFHRDNKDRVAELEAKVRERIEECVVARGQRGEIQEKYELEKQKVAILERWAQDGTVEVGDFEEWLSDSDWWDDDAPEGQKWVMVADGGIDRLTLVKEQTRVEYWKNCEGNEDDAPEALLNALAEKCGLKTIDFKVEREDEGISKLGELWDKIMDVMEER